MSLQLVQIIKASKTNPIVDRAASLRQVKGLSRTAETAVWFMGIRLVCSGVLVHKHQ